MRIICTLLLRLFLRDALNSSSSKTDVGRSTLPFSKHSKANVPCLLAGQNRIFLPFKLLSRSYPFWSAIRPLMPLISGRSLRL